MTNTPNRQEEQYTEDYRQWQSQEPHDQDIEFDDWLNSEPPPPEEY